MSHPLNPSDPPAEDPERPAGDARDSAATGGPSADDAPAAAATTTALPTKPRSPRRSWLVELPVVVGVALVISLLLKTFLVQAFWIPSGSMEDTLLVKDRVLVEKITGHARSIHRGDVIVFHDPGDWLPAEERIHSSGVRGAVRDVLAFVGLAPAATGDDLIKRVIGVPGDRVLCCDPQGRVSVNGTALDEPYLFPGSAPSDVPFDVTVPSNSLWVMGDHRDDSQDSRAHQSDARKGMVPFKDVVGRAFVVVWPLDRFQRLSPPATFNQPGLSGPAK